MFSLFTVATLLCSVASISAAPQAGTRQFTIKIVNQLGEDVQLKHDPDRGQAKFLKTGSTTQFAVPYGWHGNVALLQSGAGHAFMGDESLIEGSFVPQAGIPVPMFDIDVSYVTGFSVPVTCSCENRVVTGCSQNLYSLHNCPNNNGKGSCKNPNRDTMGGATDFFKPCQHMAYTYPDDHAANANGLCKSGVVTCCIGTSCAPHPTQ